MAGAGVDALGGAVPLSVVGRAGFAWVGRRRRRRRRLLQLFSPVAEFFPADVVEFAAAGSMSFGSAGDGVCGGAAAEMMAVVQAAAGGAEWVSSVAFVTDPEPRHGLIDGHIFGEVSLCDLGVGVSVAD